MRGARWISRDDFEIAQAYHDELWRDGRKFHADMCACEECDIMRVWFSLPWYTRWILSRWRNVAVFVGRSKAA